MQEFGRLQVLPPGFPDFMEREREAEVMYIFETMVITGLFQTPEYAYEVLRSANTSETVEHLVATRMKRQKILERENPPHVVAIFDEGAVRRPIGAPDVLKDQIRHLIDLSDLHHVTIQTVRTAKGACPGLPGAFMLLSFRDDLDVVHVEGHIGAQFIDHPDAVRKHGKRFDLIRASAMSAEDSLTLLRTILES